MPDSDTLDLAEIERWLHETPPGEMDYVAAAHCEGLLKLVKRLREELVESRDEESAAIRRLIFAERHN